jgi:hypothetical protein
MVKSRICVVQGPLQALAFQLRQGPARRLHAPAQAVEPRQTATKETAGTRRYALRSRTQQAPSDEPYKVSIN